MFSIWLNYMYIEEIPCLKLTFKKESLVEA